jgi:hypothetical protein
MKITTLMPTMNSMINYLRNKAIKTLKSFHKSCLTIFAVLTVSAVALVSCEEDPSPIGSDLLPGDDFAAMVSTDTLAIRAFTMYVDSVRSTDSLYYLGTRYSPWFGTTRAEIVTQLNLLRSWTGSGFVIDSVSIVLAIDNYKGDSLATTSIELYEISEYLSKETAYYSNKPVQIERYIGTYQLEGLKADTLLEVMIPTDIGTYLLRDTTKLFISSTVPDFREFFRGIYVKVVDGLDPVFFTLQSLSSTSGIQVYYHTPSVTNGYYSFVFSDKSARYKRLIHDFTTAEPAKKIRHINDMVLDTLSFLQSYNGVFTRLEIPGLAQFKSMMPASVNKARLTIPALIDGTDFTDITVPQSLKMRYTGADGKKVDIPDMYFGWGGYFPEKDHYAFDLASFVQEYLEGRIAEPVVEIYMLQSSQYDVIFKVNAATQKPKLQLSLTKF